MDWHKLVVQAGSADAGRIEALLQLAGAEYIALSDAADDPVLEPEPGTTPLWPDVELTAAFAADVDADALEHWLRGALPHGARVGRLTVSADTDWLQAAAPRAPLLIGRRLAVVPAAAQDAPPDRVTVRLNMGLAFGTGEHPTTQLCLDWLERTLGGGESVLDYGCGSGVLALAALALGARSAVATDIDPQALTATADNAALNGFGDRLATYPADALRDDAVDIVVANILARPLVDAADALAQRVVAGGRIALTGILEEQAESVRSAYAAAFDHFEETKRDGWTLLSARRST